MDNDKMPHPVAWRCNWNSCGEIAWVEYHDETDPLPEKWDAPPNETLPLYSAETVQALQAECEEQARLNGMGAEREARLMAQVAELRKLVVEQDSMLGRKLCAGLNADGNPRCHELAEARAERDAIIGAFGNAQLAAFIEKHGNPVPLVDELEALKAERDALAKDAARIDWIGAHVKAVILHGDTAPRLLWADTELPRYPRDVRSGIDAAMAEGER